MPKASKRQQAQAEKMSPDKQYGLDDAVALLTEFASGKFPESFDVAIKLGIDVRKADQTVRGATLLPHGAGKKVRVAVFAEGEDAAAAQAAGADLVGMDDLAAKIKAGEMDFDVAIATPNSMSIVAPLGQLLGPRGLMPNPKTGTVTDQVGKAVTNAKAGQLQFRADKGGVIHGSIGRVGFAVEAVRENMDAVLTDLKKAKPPSAKGIYFQKITLSTTMGFGLTIDQTSLSA